MVQVLKDYLDDMQRLRKDWTGRIEQPSERVENQVNVLVQAETFEGCQSIIESVMDECASATFTLPVKSADGPFIAIGHYTKADDELPEFLKK